MNRLLVIICLFFCITMNTYADPGEGTGGLERRNTGFGPFGKSQNVPDNIECWPIIGPPAKRHLNGV